jgi:hypothetical protein
VADTVEKVAASLLQSTSKKIDLSDRPTSRSRASVKGKKTPENLMRETVIDFFNSIGRIPTDGSPRLAFIERAYATGRLRQSSFRQAAARSRQWALETSLRFLVAWAGIEPTHGTRAATAHTVRR